jgi:hypothetical protein
MSRASRGQGHVLVLAKRCSQGLQSNQSPPLQLKHISFRAKKRSSSPSPSDILPTASFRLSQRFSVAKDTEFACHLPTTGHYFSIKTDTRRGADEKGRGSWMVTHQAGGSEGGAVMTAPIGEPKALYANACLPLLTLRIIE